jgi:hypothetical protein
MDITAGRPPTEGDGDGWPGRRRLLAGVLAVVLLAAGALVTVLISHGKVIDGNATNPTSTSDGPTQGPKPFQPHQDRSVRRG